MFENNKTSERLKMKCTKVRTNNNQPNSQKVTNLNRSKKILREEASMHFKRLTEPLSLQKYFAKSIF
jgi:hypothetical protein